MLTICFWPALMLLAILRLGKAGARQLGKVWGWLGKAGARQLGKVGGRSGLDNNSSALYGLDWAG